MNIKEAKEQIVNAMKAYFTKNEYGEYVIPTEKQRPIFLMGPPGIGKTAIMEQIAAELGVGLVSYSMTHHTRQSALGLPFIRNRVYNGKEYSVSEYTMSEIISSVYEMMEENGIKEGILFLDEINCVSETLAPSMLQFLQYKIFGRHKVPDGWIVVTAGNPPEYNNTVREFDIVTWDRMKRIDVEPDYEVWREYAMNSGVHASILTYLDIKKRSFYSIETTVDGKSFVTARGWSDLAEMIKLYEAKGITVDLKLIQQYLQNKTIAKDFAVYYDLFNKYKSDYQIPAILRGKATEEIKERAKKAKFDERFAVLGLLLDSLIESAKEIWLFEKTLFELMNALRSVRVAIEQKHEEAQPAIQKEISARKQRIEQAKNTHNLSGDERQALQHTVTLLTAESGMIKSDDGEHAPFDILKKDFEEQKKKLGQMTAQMKDSTSNCFLFCEEVFEEGQEMVILVTELTRNLYTAQFISRYGCEEYFKHNKELLFYERQKELISQIESLDADGISLN